MALIFGMAGIHRLPTHRQRQLILNKAISVGFTYFDVAPAYGNGLNEVELGHALHGKRQQFQISTKFGIPCSLYGARYPTLFPLIRMLEKVFSRDYGSAFNRRVFSAHEMEHSLDDSLSRLKTDYVDRFMIHEPLEIIEKDIMNELCDCAASLKQKGKIRSFGIAGRYASIGGNIESECIDVVQTKLSDIRLFDDLLHDKHKVAYGLFRTFCKDKESPDQSFIDFVANKLSGGDDMDFILTSSSMDRIQNFESLFI